MGGKEGKLRWGPPLGLLAGQIHMCQGGLPFPDGTATYSSRQEEAIHFPGGMAQFSINFSFYVC